MSFAPRHSKARVPFRVLAFIILLFALLATITKVISAFSLPFTLLDMLSFIALCFFSIACGVIAFTGRAPQWIIKTKV